MRERTYNEILEFPMLEVDDQLRAEAALWRKKVDQRMPHFSVRAAPAPQPRKHRRRGPVLAASLTAAAALATGIALVNLPATRSGGGGSASCADAYLTANPTSGPAAPDNPSTLGEVRPGAHVTVYGRWYMDYSSCNDTSLGSPTYAPVESRRDVILQLITDDQRIATTVTVHPDQNGSFISTLQIPSASTTGPAIISDGEGHRVDLVIRG